MACGLQGPLGRTCQGSGPSSSGVFSPMIGDLHTCPLPTCHLVGCREALRQRLCPEIRRPSRCWGESGPRVDEAPLFV